MPPHTVPCYRSSKNKDIHTDINICTSRDFFITLKCCFLCANLHCVLKIYSGDKTFTHLSMQVKFYMINKTTILFV